MRHQPPDTTVSVGSRELVLNDDGAGLERVPVLLMRVRDISSVSYIDVPASADEPDHTEEGEAHAS
jgi:hypothetical protein